jgi:hypothetical protein
MRKWMLVSVCALCALVFSACVDAPDPEFEIVPGMEKEAGQVADGVLRSDEQELPGFEIEEVEPPIDVEAPEHPARLEWLLPSGDEADTAQEALRLRIENLLPSGISVYVYAQFFGLLGKEARVELGVHEVSAGGEIVLEVPAEAVPLQSTDTFCQAEAGAIAAADGTTSDETDDALGVPAAAVFYRFGAGYQGVSAYSETQVRQQFDGRLVDVAENVTDDNLPAVLDTVIGRVVEGESSSDVLLRDAVATNTADDEGVWITGYGFGLPGTEDTDETLQTKDVTPGNGDRSVVYLRYCSRWRSNFTDVEGGEDIYTTTGDTLREAQYSHVQLWQQSNLLDEDYMVSYSSPRYCTKYFAVNQGQSYTVVHRTTLRRDDRQIMILDDNANWDAATRYSLGLDSSWYVTGDAPAYNTVSVDHGSTYKQTSMAVVARKVLNRAVDLGYVNSGDDRRVYINMEYPQDSEECPNTCCYHYGKICNGGTDTDPNPDITGPPGHAICYGSSSGTSVEKFKAGHEIGHAIAHQSSSQGPMPTSYKATNSASIFHPSAWACQTGEDTHALHSREFIGAAQGEGFAHFVGATLFNDRETDGWFGYYKTARLDNSNSEAPVYWVDVTDDKQHLHTYCAPSGWTGVGTEWDWLNFFWNIWTIGDYKWSVPDMYTIWSGTSSTTKCCLTPTNCVNPNPGCQSGWEYAPFGKKWSSLQTTVDNSGWSQNKRDRFSNQGLASRVNY